MTGAGGKALRGCRRRRRAADRPRYLTKLLKKIFSEAAFSIPDCERHSLTRSKRDFNIKLF